MTTECRPVGPGGPARRSCLLLWVCVRRTPVSDDHQAAAVCSCHRACRYAAWRCRLSMGVGGRWLKRRGQAWMLCATAHVCLCVLCSCPLVCCVSGSMRVCHTAVSPCCVPPGPWPHLYLLAVPSVTPTHAMGVGSQPLFHLQPSTAGFVTVHRMGAWAVCMQLWMAARRGRT
jgi:hypothetical protein